MKMRWLTMWMKALWRRYVDLSQVTVLRRESRIMLYQVTIRQLLCPYPSRSVCKSILGMGIGFRAHLDTYQLLPLVPKASVATVKPSSSTATDTQYAEDRARTTLSKMILI